MVASLSLSVACRSSDVPSTYRQHGQVYVSPESEMAAAGIELTVSGGIGGITIEQSSE